MPNQSQFPLHSPDPQTIDATLNLTQFRVEKQIYRQSTFHVKVCRIIFPLNLRKISPRGKRLFQPFSDDRKSLRSPQLFTVKFNQKKERERSKVSKYPRAKTSLWTQVLRPIKQIDTDTVVCLRRSQSAKLFVLHLSPIAYFSYLFCFIIFRASLLSHTKA